MGVSDSRTKESSDLINISWGF